MTLRVAHELGLALAVSLAFLAVLLGGELPPVLWGALAIPPVGIFLHNRGQAAPALLATGLGLAGMVAGLGAIAQRGVDAALLGGGIALVSLLSARLLVRQTLGHDLQALLLSLLLVFAGAALHTQVTFGVVFAIYAICVVWALVTRQLVAGALRESERPGGAALDAILARRDVVTPTFFVVTGGVALAILLSTAVLFLFFPRVGWRNLGLLGFSRTLLPGEASLRDDPRAGGGGGAVVARVSGLPVELFEEGLYLRGPLYDRLGPSGFARTPFEPSDPSVYLPLAQSDRQGTYGVFLQPLGDRTLLTLGAVERARVVAGGFANPSLRNRLLHTSAAGALRAFNEPSGPMRYRVAGSIITAASSMPKGKGWAVRAPAHEAQLLTRYLELPAELDPRISMLAAELVQRAKSDADKTNALLAFLADNFAYTLDLPSRDAPDPLAAFIFDDRRGHCEYFATALAVMLRAVDVPSRVVGGFQGGMWDTDGRLAVFTGANAHAWTEWYARGQGWVLADATPATAAPPLYFAGLGAWWEHVRRAWDEQVLEYGLPDQLAMLRQLARAMGGPNQLDGPPVPWRTMAKGLFVVLLALATFIGLRRYRRRARDKHHPLLSSLNQSSEHLGVGPLQPHATARESVQAIVATLGDGAEGDSLGETLDEALLLYEQERFGSRPRAPKHVRELARQVQQTTQRYLETRRLGSR